MHEAADLWTSLRRIIPSTVSSEQSAGSLEPKKPGDLLLLCVAVFAAQQLLPVEASFGSQGRHALGRTEWDFFWTN